MIDLSACAAVQGFDARYPCGHRRIEAAIGEWQPLGRSVDSSCKRRGALLARRLARLDRGRLAIARLIRSGSGTHVEHCRRVAQSCPDGLFDSRIRSPVVRVTAADHSVVGVPGATVCSPLDHPVSLPQPQGAESGSHGPVHVGTGRDGDLLRWRVGEEPSIRASRLAVAISRRCQGEHPGQTGSRGVARVLTSSPLIAKSAIRVTTS